jgi:hypothetical protein
MGGACGKSGAQIEFESQFDEPLQAETLRADCLFTMERLKVPMSACSDYQC